MSSNSTAVKAEHAVSGAAQVGMGQVGSFGHPIHPSTVHFPIGLLVASFSLDALQLAPSVANALNSFNLLPPTTLLRPLAHYSGAAGALLSLPAIATGISELYMMWRGGVKNTQSVGAIAGDLKNAAMTEKIQGEKIRTTLQHASLNDAVVGIAAWNWWVRRKSATLALPRVNAIASAVALPLFFYSAYLGGSLVYEYGVGVQRQGQAAQIKELAELEQKKANKSQ